jgi:hypothetical protein
MVLNGFGSGIGLVWIIGSSLLVNSFVLCGATTIVLCGAINIVLCGGNNPRPMWDTNYCPLWDTPHSVVNFLFNWLVWSVVKLWVE